MGSESKSTSPTSSTAYNDSLNRTVTNSLGQGAAGLSAGGSINGASLANYTNSFNSPTTVSIINSLSSNSNTGSGSASGGSSPTLTPSISAGTGSPPTQWSDYLPWILLAGGLWVVWRLLATK